MDGDGKSLTGTSFSFLVKVSLGFSRPGCSYVVMAWPYPKYDQHGFSTVSHYYIE